MQATVVGVGPHNEISINVPVIAIRLKQDSKTGISSSRGSMKRVAGNGLQDRKLLERQPR